MSFSTFSHFVVWIILPVKHLLPRDAVQCDKAKFATVTKGQSLAQSNLPQLPKVGAISSDKFATITKGRSFYSSAKFATITKGRSLAQPNLPQLPKVEA